MNESDQRGERTVALALLGAVLFSNPLLDGFADSMGLVLGIPSLYLYLFLAWALVIALLAWVVERAGGTAARPPDPPAAEDDREAR